MTIHLSKDLENSIRSLVQGGQYASVDDAMDAAAAPAPPPAGPPGSRLLRLTCTSTCWKSAC